MGQNAFPLFVLGLKLADCNLRICNLLALDLMVA